MGTNKKGKCVRLISLCLVLLAGCGALGTAVVHLSSQIIDDADYNLVSVTISGPSTIPKNGQATYDVAFTFNVLSANTAMISPFVLLADNDGGLRFDDDPLVVDQHSEASPGPGQFTRHMSLTLKCNDDIVEGVAASRFGSVESSAEGYTDIFGTNEAEVYARVQRGQNNPTQSVNSAVMDVWCI